MSEICVSSSSLPSFEKQNKTKSTKQIKLKMLLRLHVTTVIISPCFNKRKILMVLVDMKCFIFANPSIFNLPNYTCRKVKRCWQYRLN